MDIHAENERLMRSLEMNLYDPSDSEADHQLKNVLSAKKIQLGNLNQDKAILPLIKPKLDKKVMFPNIMLSPTKTNESSRTKKIKRQLVFKPDEISQIKKQPHFQNLNQ